MPEDTAPKSFDSLVLSAPRSPAPKMPVAPIRPTKFAFHGDDRIDKYHWLANNISTDPAVMQYIDAENAYTSQVLSDTLDMQTDFAMLHAIRFNEEAQKAPLHRSSKYLYFEEQRQNADYPAIVRRPAPLGDAAPAAESLEPFDKALETVIDFQQESKGYAYFSVMNLRISPDDHLLIYILDTTGSEVGTLFMYNMTSKTPYLEAPIENVCSDVVLSGDQLWYIKQTEHQRCNQLYRHELGTDPASDSLAFAVATPESTIYLTRGTSYMYIVAEMPDISEWYVVDQADIDSGVVRLLPGEPNVRYTVEERIVGLVICRDDASEGTTETRLATPAHLEHLSRGHELEYASLPELLPKQMGVEIEQNIVAPKHYITLETRRGCAEVAIRRLQKDPEWKTFSEPDYISAGDCLTDASMSLRLNKRNETVVVLLGTSPTVPSYETEYNLETKETNFVNTVIMNDYSPLNYTTERIAALSWDGQRIPISLLYKPSRVLKDGTAPLLLEVYGSYGVVSRTTFSRHNIDLADQGFVVAKAHVRGGGALGRQWHHAGWRTSKMNTINDTISVIDHLVAQNYTSHQRTALIGRSAGGLAVAAIANLAPTKARAIVTEVPFLDCLTKLLNSSQPGVVENHFEFGDPRANKTVYDYIQSYSPYDNIKREPDFPHILVTAHLNDVRIRAWGPATMHAAVGAAYQSGPAQPHPMSAAFWEPAKYVAKLREFKANDNMVLLRVTPGGHLKQAMSHADTAALRETTAFIFKALNVEYNSIEAHELLQIRQETR